MKHYAISDVRFISHGIALNEKPKTNEKVLVQEIKTGTLYCYEVCGYFFCAYTWQTELKPLFSPNPLPFCKEIKTLKTDK